MYLPWPQRKARLSTLLSSQGDEDEDGLALDRVLHGQNVIGKTAKTKEIDGLRFTDKDVGVVGTLEYGQYGVIDVVNCHLNGRVYVRKSIDKRLALKTRDQCFPQFERDILLRAGVNRSEWAPHLLCAYQTPTHLNLVMDYIEGGTIWDVLESSPSDGRVSEEDLNWWAPQIVSAIHWCHTQGFVHRDIKPHNFVLTTSSHVLLIDFGSVAPLLPPRSDGSQLVPKQYCLVPCGTCDYISPEILQAHEAALLALEMEDDTRDASASFEAGGYGLETDWWSLGAMLYELAYGVAPFFAKDIRQTYMKIMDYETSLRFSKSVPLSAACRDLLRRLLTDRGERLGRRNVMEITEHPFFEGTNWSALHSRPAPSNLHLPQFTYTAASNNAPPEQQSLLDESYSQPFAFSAFFQSSKNSSPGISALHATPGPKPNRSAIKEQTTASFIGFSWGPALDAFPSELSDEVLSRASHSPFIMETPKPHRLPSIQSTPLLVPPKMNQGTPGALHSITTPMRRSVLTPHHTLPRASTVRRTVPRRAVSDREAMKQLVDCVGMSARKKVLESGRKPRVLTSFGRSGSLKKELRFMPMPTDDESSSSQFQSLTAPLPALFTGSSSASEGSESEGPPSPSPSPRPGSVMSRRSQTPTISASYTRTALLGTPSATTSRFQPTPTWPASSNANQPDHDQSTREKRCSSPIQTFSNLEGVEKRHLELMGRIEDIERRLRDLIKRVSGEG